MVNNNHSRKGSLQFYPRVRSKKIIPNINWNIHNKKECSLLGFIGYKVGMTSVFVKDNTPDSMTKGKRITIPATIIECPLMKIYSVRFYKDGKVKKDILVTNDKDLRRKVKVPKVAKYFKEEEDFDDVFVILYSDTKSISINKKKPDLLEFKISGTKEEKISFIKSKIGKSLSVIDFFNNGLVDIHAVTKGYGTQGPVKRFGIGLKDHKSEKGIRRPGSLSSFGLRRVTFRAPQAGQTGYHSRVLYNSLILDTGKIKEKDINQKSGFHKYGNIKTEYILVKGSIPGPKKRGLVLTVAQRPSKSTSKKSYEVLELR
jgi:large subunit ribosomal protein L3